ncbi:MAG: YjjG family noncanonical pyrimidine nucleotidase [Flavobacteriales bacterium]|mgnify:CR=1 FL=1|nr:YjjG family noncanonical pyrimidine nucleotidase [Flavobacteriales bacterium]
MKKYTHLFFDLDGTLWDLRINAHNALSILFSNYNHQGLDKIDFEKFISRYHFHNDQVWTLYRKGQIEKNVLRTIRFERAFADVGIEKPAWLNDFSNEFLEICPRQTQLVEGTKHALDTLSKIYQLHIITNGFKEVQGLKLDAGGITHYFSHIINSEDCGVRKPNAAIFEFALKTAGALKETSLMIGDDWEADILGARDFGMDQAFLTTTEESLAGESGIRHNYTPTYTIRNMYDLLDFL